MSTRLMNVYTPPGLGSDGNGVNKVVPRQQSNRKEEREGRRMETRQVEQTLEMPTSSTTMPRASKIRPMPSQARENKTQQSPA